MAAPRWLAVGASVAAIHVGITAVPTTLAEAHDSDDAERDDTSMPINIRPTTGSVRLLEGFGSTIGEHVDVMNADHWHDAGIDGGGITVGVIDFFDVTRYWDEDEHGPTPVAGVSAACFDDGDDCTDEFFDGDDRGGEDHGVAVVEAILDIAPGATILVGQAVTVGDYDRLVDWFAARDVDVVNRSLGSRYDGPGDGRGELNEIVDRAVDLGMLWVNSAGNNGRNKYYRHPVRLRGDRVAFGPDGDETFLPFTGCVALGGVRWANDWDVAPADRTDYDVLLWDSPTGDPSAGTVIDRSERRQRLGETPIEFIVGTRCPSAGSSLYLEVIWSGGDPTGDVLEILDYGSGIAAFTTDEGSAAVPVVDSRNPGVLAVGAIDPVDGGTVAVYSSRGPSADGRVLPDLSAPANVSSAVFGRFAGTSAAAATVAGTAALLADAGLAAGPVALADLARHLVIDRGPSGSDNASGRGELRLPAESPGEIDASPSIYVGLDVPARVLDTRTDSVGVERGEIVELSLADTAGLPAAAELTAVAVNVVSVSPDRPGFVQAMPTGTATVGGFSTLNTDAAGQIRANFAIVPVGSDGSISLYSIADGDLVVDLLGWFERVEGEVAAGRFVAFPTATRLTDTRDEGPDARLRSGAPLRVATPGGLVDEQAASLVITVTAVDASEPGWLQAVPAGRPEVIGTTSTLNIGVGGAVANTAIVPVGDDGIAIAGSFGAGTGPHVVVDAVGYITSAATPSSADGRFVAVAPGRAFDSREAAGPLPDEAPIVVDAADGSSSVPASASAVVWNAAIVEAARPGFARTWSDDAARPATSSLNWSVVGETRAGAVISAADGGRASFELDDGGADLADRVGDLIVDVFGYFT